MRIGRAPAGAKRFPGGMAGGVSPRGAESTRLGRRWVRKEKIRFVESNRLMKSGLSQLRSAQRPWRGGADLAMRICRSDAAGDRPALRRKSLAVLPIIPFGKPTRLVRLNSVRAMRSYFLLVFLGCAGSLFGETPKQWLSDFQKIQAAGRSEAINDVEQKLPGDTTFREIWGESVKDQTPMLLYLLEYYLAKDPERLQWNKGFWESQVRPCNCGKENAIDTEAFRRLLPAFTKAGNAWETLDPKIRERYEKVQEERVIPEDKMKRHAQEWENLRVRFESLKHPNKSSQSTTPSVTPPAGQEARQP